MREVLDPFAQNRISVGVGAADGGVMRGCAGKPIETRAAMVLSGNDLFGLAHQNIAATFRTDLRDDPW